MFDHFPALTFGTGGHQAPDDASHRVIDYTDVREICLACVIEADEATTPGPCPQATTAADLVPGTLVQIVPAPRWSQVPAHSAIVVSTTGKGTGAFVVLWFWSLGQPDLMTTVFTARADEVTPMSTTLAALPTQTYRALAAAHAAAEGFGARLLARIAEPIATAAH